MNLTTSNCDLERYSSADDLRSFYTDHGCGGLELMPLPYMEDGVFKDADTLQLIQPDMITGVHACCINDWMYLDRASLIKHYRKDLEYARKTGAEYVVFHITQISFRESFTYQMEHGDDEVIDAAADLINELLDGHSYSFWFLMENLWWPGLTFLSAASTKRLLDRVHYQKKGLMLDTGHFLHTNRKLRTQEEGLSYLNRMLDSHETLLSCIKGIHLQQSLSGAYVEQWLQNLPPLPAEGSPDYYNIMFEHIFAIDQHKPFTAPGVRDLAERIRPQYVTFEYISRSREELGAYLEAGSLPFRSKLISSP